MMYLLFLKLCIIVTSPITGLRLQCEGSGENCEKKNPLYPHPVYHTLEEGEMRGLRVVEALYGEESTQHITGYHQIEQMASRIPAAKHSRHKRAVTAKENLYWPKAIVPYTFVKDVPLYEKKETTIAMKRHERFTCVRFVPWVQNQTKWEYDLPDEAHMLFVKRDGCWANIGNNHSPGGVKISCCDRKPCVHEISHILGVFHDQNSPGRHGWTRINWNNIPQKYWSIFIEEEPSTTLVYRYDISSIMHYNTHGFTLGPWPSMTVLFQDLMPLINIGGNLYYLWQEIAETNQCKARHCPDFPIDCINDGYVSFVEEECRCICPPGLDYRSGCRTVIKEAHAPDFWPSGSFGVFAASGGCPTAELTDLEFPTEAQLVDQSSSFHLGGNITDEGVDLLLCMKDAVSRSTNKIWQTGSYCLLANNGICPTEFEVVPIPIPGLNLTICCRDDGYTEDVIYLPIATSFVLLSRDINGPCQSVEGMLAVLESLELQIQRTDVKLPSYLPIKVSSSNHVTLSLCYYTKYQTDCGRVIELSRALTSDVITSPGYPSPYNPALNCHWLVKGPPYSTIVIDFEDFDINCEGDYLIIRYALLGQLATRRCGKKMDQTIRTVENVVSFHFHSGLTGQNKGFRATVRVILPENHCYNVADNGASYRGKVSFTRDFQPCLPWDKVTECPHHMFNPRDFDSNLEKNYCRNPDNSFRPWCYTKVYEGQCERNYCDVCRLEKVYDNYPDCEQLKKDGFCEKDPKLVQSQCAKTCAVPLPSREEPTICGRPPIVQDGLMKFEKRWFGVGETTYYRCPFGPEVITRRCHSDGTWTPANYVCGVCSNDWSAYNGACYKFFPQLLTHTQAVDFCALHNSILSPAKTTGELDFVTSLRPKLRRIWLGATREKREPHWTNTDETRLELENWVKGAAAVNEPKICSIINPETSKNTFRSESCKNIRPFVCKRRPSPRRVCVNRRWDCHCVLRRNPTVCVDYPDFAWQQCPFSCGLCEPFTTPFCRVTPPGLNVIDTNIVRRDYIPRGDVVKYSCSPGSVLFRGHLHRVCQSNGWLSGQQPVCVDENQVATPNNRVALVDRGSTTVRDIAYLGNNSQHRIEREGEIIQWKFYAKGKGNTCLQVWRPRPDLGPLEFEFVGQNFVKTVPNMVNIVDVPPIDRIRVIAGDVIGTWGGESQAHIVWNECGGRTMPQAENSLVLTKSFTSAMYFHIGDTQTTSVSGCRTFSLTALVNSANQMLSYTSMIPLEHVSQKITQPKNTLYTGENGYFRVRVNGSLIEWQLYSQVAGMAALQIWRPRPDIGELQLELVGQNLVNTSQDAKQIIRVPEKEQIKVKENDVIGIWFGDPPAVLAFRSCDKKDNPLAEPLLFRKHESDFVVGETYEFVKLSMCRVYPLLAIIEEDT